MALIYDGKTFRNLEEQVRKNKQDISNLEKIQTVLNEFGIHVIGKVDDETQLPASSSAFGNAYAVGIQPPYEYYIWTDLQPTPGWLNIGIFPAPSNVQGPQGEEGTSVTAANIVDGYLVLTLTDADGNDTQITVGYVKGAQGVQGPRGLQGLQGIQGEQGIQGLTGPQGPRGYTGWALNIISVLTDPANLPDPDTGDRHNAYVINDGGDDYEIYGKVEDGDGFAWHSFGLIAFSTNYVTAAQLASELYDLGEQFVDWVDTVQNPNQLTFYNNYSGNEVTTIDFARINGNPVVGVATNFQLTTKTELSSFQSALILGTFEVAIAKEAKAIQALSDESGETQDAPFILQGTGTDGNTVKVDTSKVAEIIAKTGNTEVVNSQLVNGNGVYLCCGGRNVWNEEWELKDINTDTGEKASGNFVVPKDYIRVIPNTQYYWFSPYGGIRYFYGINKEYLSFEYATANSMFTTPNNCYYILFREPTQYGITYNNDITISLYYSTGEGYNKYYPYVEPKKIYTGTEVLKSAGTVRDSKDPITGTITRIIGVVDLGTLNWEYISDDNAFRAILSTAKTGAINTIPNILCAKYTTVARTYISGISSQNKCINMGAGNSYIQICDNDYTDVATFKTAMSGVMLYYELATPTTEQGTAFPSVIDIDDYGTMYWEDENEDLVEVAQGLTVFYPADYVGFLDSLSKHLNGNASSVSTIPMLSGTSSDGTYVLKATKSGSTITYTWVLES